MEFFKSCARYGWENALWIGREMLKGYKKIVLVKVLAPVKHHHGIYAREMATFFHLGFREIKTSGSWLTRLLSKKTQAGPEYKKSI